jgi:hypothetical protein
MTIAIQQKQRTEMLVSKKWWHSSISAFGGKSKMQERRRMMTEQNGTMLYVGEGPGSRTFQIWDLGWGSGSKFLKVLQPGPSPIQNGLSFHCCQFWKKWKLMGPTCYLSLPQKSKRFFGKKIEGRIFLISSPQKFKKPCS